ncbi:LytR C-terminal domain-containing protein [Bifidobacterium sp. MA2]|uniref:LytR C-terminal domain-containing protein n=1 Tax=Bifidobacterium santillanense TaxID=2809028 RepID=A0ABS5UMZ1_9BIFI|nr:LytR C-terminal domain-containing protein [Bifidobacterium santillanense]MBT1172282.1 LytR C-terminal domain-containing protein [Bifidobacterium santillanense]
MAKSDKDKGESYEPDAFDNPPKGPAGVHRGSRSLVSRLAPFVVVVLIAALCGLVAWGFFSGEMSHITWPWSSSDTSQTASDTSSSKKSGSSSSTSSSSSSSDSSKSSDSSSSSSDTSGGDEKTADEKAKEEEAAKQAEEAKQAAEAEAQKQAEEAAAQPNKATAVRVINGTRTSGYAASRKSKLNAAGYTNVVAANPQGNLPSSTVVWYLNDSDKATAEDVASTLGISNVQQASGISTAIVVVLLS